MLGGWVEVGVWDDVCARCRQRLDCICRRHNSVVIWQGGCPVGLRISGGRRACKGLIVCLVVIWSVWRTWGCMGQPLARGKKAVCRIEL